MSIYKPKFQSTKIFVKCVYYLFIIIVKHNTNKLFRGERNTIHSEMENFYENI